MSEIKKDIVFVVPAQKKELKEESIGTLILSKIAIEAGFSVAIVRYWEVWDSCYNAFCANLINKIVSYNPSIVSFYCRCTDYHVSIDIAKKIKTYDENVRVSFGGPQAELVADETLRFFKCVDFVCCSEGESTIIPFLCGALGRNMYEISSVDGLVYRDAKGRIIHNKMPKLLESNYKHTVNYYDLIPIDVFSESHRITLDVGRGCPFSCSFCSTKTFWKQKFRLRNIVDVVNEIEFVKSRYRINVFDLDHDLFTVDKQKVMEFCNELNRRNLNIRWYCSSRIDTIDYSIIDVMVASGLDKIMFGIETASPRMQIVINKKLNLKECMDKVQYCIRKGVKVIASFMYGIPEDAEDDFELTFRMIREMKCMGVHVLVWRCGILNGTSLYDRYKSKLFITPKNAKNTSFWGFTELYDMIVEHPSVFPQFYDIPDVLREKLNYFELFLEIWDNYSPRTLNIVSFYFLNHNLRYLDIYYKFVSANLFILTSQNSIFEKISGDDYIFYNRLIKNLIEEIADSKLLCAEEYETIKTVYNSELRRQ